MWLRQRTVEIAVLHQLYSIINYKKSNSQLMYLHQEGGITSTLIDVLFNLAWSHHWFKMPYFGHILWLLRQENILLHDIQQRTSGFKLGVFLPIMSVAVTWHWLRMGPSDMYLTRKASFKDTICLCSRIVFQAVLSLDVSTQTVFTPQPLRAPGYCRTPSGRAGGRQGRQAALTLSRP